MDIKCTAILLDNDGVIINMIELFMCIMTMMFFASTDCKLCDANSLHYLTISGGHDYYMIEYLD